MFRKLILFAGHRWEWLLLATTLLILTLYLLGINMYGLNAPLTALFAVLGGLVSALVSFILAALIVPLVALVVGFFAALLTAVTGLAALLIGGIFIPLLAVFSGWFTTIMAWVGTTWLGTLLTPAYYIGSHLVKATPPLMHPYRYVVQTRIWLQGWFSRRVRKLRRSPAVASQNARRGRSSAPLKHLNAPKRARC